MGNTIKYLIHTTIMADWKNQLFAKGVDNLEQLKGIFL